MLKGLVVGVGRGEDGKFITIMESFVPIKIIVILPNKLDF